MPPNFRSASYLPAGNSAATVRQTGARALWPNEREHSPHSVCWRAPAVIYPIPTALEGKCHHSKWHTGCSKLRTSSKPPYWGSRGTVCWDLLVTVLTQSWLLTLLLPLTPCRTCSVQPKGQTSQCFQEQLATVSPARREWTFFLEKEPFFLKEHQVKVGAVLSTF